MDWKNNHKVNFFVDLRERKSRFCKQISRAFFYKTVGFISDINTQDQVKYQLKIPMQIQKKIK